MRENSMWTDRDKSKYVEEARRNLKKKLDKKKTKFERKQTSNGKSIRLTSSRQSQTGDSGQESLELENIEAEE